MSAFRVRPGTDPVEPSIAPVISITVDGEELHGPAGSSVAGILLENGRDSWRTSSRDRRPRGIFCGIGVCFDCILTVNGERDVRACQRRACDGDIVSVQDEERPETSS